MLDKSKSVVSTVGAEKEVEKITLSDINECNEKDTYGETVIEYPYKLEFKDSKGKVIMKEKSQGSLRTRQWDKKFRFNDKGYVSFWRYQSLLAVAKLKTKANNEELPKELDLNNLIGFEFDGVVVRIEGKESFIDWVETFRANDISVPENQSSVSAKEPTPQGGAW